MNITNNTQHFVTGHHAKRKFSDVDTVYKRRRVGLGINGIGAAVDVVRVPLPPMAWAYIRARPWPKGQAPTLAARRACRRSPCLPGGGIRPVRRLSPVYRATHMLDVIATDGIVAGLLATNRGSDSWCAPGWLAPSWSSPNNHPTCWYPVDAHLALDHHPSDVIAANGETSSVTSSECSDGQDANEGIATQAHSLHDREMDELVSTFEHVMQQHETTSMTTSAQVLDLDQEFQDLGRKFDCLTHQEAGLTGDPATPIASPQDGASGSAGSNLSEHQVSSLSIQNWVEERRCQQGPTEPSLRALGIDLMYVALARDILRDTQVEGLDAELDMLAGSSNNEIIQRHRQTYAPGMVGHIKLPGEHTPSNSENDGDQDYMDEIVKQQLGPIRPQ
ncbi:hypothetical protein GGH13_002601 [Coemansia sp. S155-1]|nr:hypothetical protein GGH13_002601 [Coemansia sp. S155-1]KAJ2427737.1 hypothetical protein GGF41_001586 [Coemansia sp. RSA 2531]